VELERQIRAIFRRGGNDTEVSGKSSGLNAEGEDLGTRTYHTLLSFRQSQKTNESGLVRGIGNQR